MKNEARSGVRISNCTSGGDIVAIAQAGAKAGDVVEVKVDHREKVRWPEDRSWRVWFIIAPLWFAGATFFEHPVGERVAEYLMVAMCLAIGITDRARAKRARW